MSNDIAGRLQKGTTEIALIPRGTLLTDALVKRIMAKYSMVGRTLTKDEVSECLEG